MARGELYNKMIHSRQWRTLRAEMLAAHPLCQRCHQEGRVSAATDVHHVIPVESGTTPAEQRRLMFNPTNLRALCRQCHSVTHTEMGRSTKEQARERVRRCVEGFISRYLDPE